LGDPVTGRLRVCQYGTFSSGRQPAETGTPDPTIISDHLSDDVRNFLSRNLSARRRRVSGVGTSRDCMQIGIHLCTHLGRQRCIRDGPWAPSDRKAGSMDGSQCTISMVR